MRKIKLIKALTQINGLQKVWISNVNPEIDAGVYAAKTIINKQFIVSADIFCDGIDEITALLLYKKNNAKKWKQKALLSLGNDRWKAYFVPNELGVYTYTIIAWANEYLTWKKRFLKKLEFNDDLSLEKQIGLQLLDKVEKSDFQQKTVNRLKAASTAVKLKKILTNPKLDRLMLNHLSPLYITRYEKQLNVIVDPVKAQFSSWYELFPRSLADKPNQHGTLKDLLKQLPRIKKMGFDVIYLPPIHPIGETNRKGKNNAVSALAKDLGSPWAIGAKEGGHKSIHPLLGTLADFKHLINSAKELQIDIALDFAIQCSPDHPYIKEHPEWFKQRPDGSLQYAENPPKKYQDIYPINFSSSQWPKLWLELRSIVEFWIAQGVRIFRVDNPHTKSFIFWQWLFAEIKAQYPEVLFLAEAFTRPRVMEHLAKCGFSQSYTYFTWRNEQYEIKEYLNELNSSPMVHYFRPNFWPNTPDILPEILQKGGIAAFRIRFILAATLSSNYGIYGPAFEYGINKALHDKSEEYLDSEKYQTITWEHSEHNICDLISQVNAIRQAHSALQNTHSLKFYHSDNEQIICYSKHSEDQKDIILVVVNLDYQFKQSAFITINLKKLGVETTKFQVKDLLSNQNYQWEQGKCYVELDPHKKQCAHIFYVKDDVDEQHL